MVFATSCRHNEKLDSIKDQELIRAMNSAKNQSDKDIDIDALENCITIYEKKGEKGKICLCEAYIGYKLFFEEDYDKSLIHLKRAEKNIQYCDSISPFIYSYIIRNIITTDSLLALHYAKKALNKDIELKNLKGLPYSYLDMSLLTKRDSARYYLAKSLEYFDDWGDKIAKCRYAWWHRDELKPDTIIAYAKPCYDSIKYTGHARILAEAYLRKGDANSALPYIEHIGRNKKFKTDYHFYNSRRLTLLGEHEKANESWEMAYDLLLEESKFMFSQRLGAINAEYDLLNAELENKKEKLRIRGAYNVALLIVIAILVATYVIKERHRKNATKLKMDVDELEQDVCVLEQNVSNLEENVNSLELNVSHLEENVNNLEQEVCDLERDILKRKE